MTAAEPGSPPIVVERNEILLPGPAAALAGLLDVADPGLEAGGMPIGWAIEASMSRFALRQRILTW
ncbi:MAG: hypothetical protein LCH82_06555 [Actinobacteria bacterium]|nr:hypothetical protein [Actinomycetota bacterium]